MVVHKVWSTTKTIFVNKKVNVLFVHESYTKLAKTITIFAAEVVGLAASAYEEFYATLAIEA